MSAQGPNEQRAVDAQLAILAISGKTHGLMFCPLVLWSSNPATEGWMPIYQQAHEQIVQMFSPSPLQRALEPSSN
jgi:hypothetical protein